MHDGRHGDACAAGAWLRVDGGSLVRVTAVAGRCLLSLGVVAGPATRTGMFVGWMGDGEGGGGGEGEWEGAIRYIVIARNGG